MSDATRREREGFRLSALFLVGALAAACGSAGGGGDDVLETGDEAGDSGGDTGDGDGRDGDGRDGDGRDGDAGEVPVTCGDGITDPEEDCDDGNRVAGDGCENDCTWTCVADGDCDDGNECSGTETCSGHACVGGTPLPDGDPCTTTAGEAGSCRGGTCTPVACGNGVVNTDEECDDGNTTPGDGCEADCTWSCTVDGDCDDGNSCNGAETCPAHVCTAGTPPDEGDPCTTTAGGAGACRGGLCADASCGNGAVNPGEACDDGNADNTDACLSDCATASCGDGFVRSGVEECDTSVARSCGTSCGGTGAEACTACTWEGTCTPPGEVCNAADDDCDTAVDNGFACIQGATLACTTSCGTAGSNVCTAACAVPATCTPPGEVCNAADDDCDTAADNGFACIQGATLACTTTCGTAGSNVCTATCTVPATCTPPVEACNGADDDCDTAPDNGFACILGASGSCATSCGSTGTRLCDASCAWGTCTPPVEVCNGADDDCDTTVDNGFACLAGTTGSCTTTCGTAGTRICDPTCAWGACVGPAETCNGADDDCDGLTDEGNPGGGVSCGASLGGCTTQTACVGGALVCRGTFVSPSGLPTNPGTQAAPLSTIAAAQVNAGLIGGGADVCICDPPAAGATTYNENVTMVEGTSVLGGYRCDTWARTIGTYVTRIQDQDADGLTFPAGLTVVTALDGVTVDGQDVAAGGTTAITVTNSSPSLLDVTVTGGTAADAVGLRVTETAGSTAAPTILRGNYTAIALSGGTATAVRLEASSPRITDTIIGGGSSGGLATAATSYGIRCIDCAGTTMTNGSVNGGAATTRAFGLYGTGDLTGVSFTSTGFQGGSTTAASSSSSGVFLESCTGSPDFVTATAWGGFSMGGIFGTRTAFEAEGATCSPRVSGGRYTGCEVGDTCIGVACRTSAPCTILNATIVGSTGPGNRDYGVRCLTGGCTSLAGNDMRAGTLSATGPEGIGLEVDGASPSVDDNHILGPGGGTMGMASGRYFGVYLRTTRSLLTNNVIEAGSHGGLVQVVRYDMTTMGPALIEPTLHSNTIDYAACTGCGARTGIAAAAGAGGMPSPSGVFRNNIVRHTAAGGITMPVRELDTMSDLRIFENNDLYDPTSGGVYVDEGTTTLNITQVNTTIGTGNIDLTCQLNATWHLPVTSPCRNAGTATGAPDHDFDADSRPRETFYDIGADEYVP